MGYRLKNIISVLEQDETGARRLAMIIPNEYKKYKNTSLDCPIYDENNPDYRCSVDCDKTNYRKKQGKAEHDKRKVYYYDICKLIDVFLSKIKIDSECICIKGVDILLLLNYEVIKRQYKLNDQSDMVWLRFTNDGYLGVVGSSNDINFDKDTNSYKIIKYSGCEWDENRIIIIPLPEIKNREERELVEKMVGNYLLDNGVPIIDKYSHMGFKR